MTVEFKVNNADKILSELDSKIEKALEAVGSEMENKAVQNLSRPPERIDTATLKNSITHAIGGHPVAKPNYSPSQVGKHGRVGKPVPYSGNAGKANDRKLYVGTNISYAPFVEFGTQKMPANHFLRDALMGHNEEYLKIMKIQFESEGE